MKHIFQYYAISDTGSVDNSIEEIRKWMKQEGKEGEVTLNPWEDDFGKNRTYALQLAYKVAKTHDPKGEHTWYAMFHDADNEAWSEEQKVIPLTDESRKNGKKFPWNKDSRKNLKSKRIEAKMRSGINEYAYTWMICIQDKGKINSWRWLCSRHEYVDDCGTGNSNSKQLITGGYIHSGRDGARSKTGVSKYWTDAIALLREINDPTSESPKPRLVFYLANSFKDAEWWDKAAYYYEKRLLMGGFLEEVLHSYINLFYMYFNMGKPPEIYIKPLFEAMVLFPHRLEAVSKYVDLMIKNNRHHEAWLTGSKFLGTPFPKNDLLFVETNLYLYAFDLKMLLCCYYSGLFKINTNYSEGKLDQHDKSKDNIMGQIHGKQYKEIINRLLQNPNLPNKSDLYDFIKNTAGIWTETEKSVLYKIVKYNQVKAHPQRRRGHTARPPPPPSRGARLCGRGAPPCAPRSPHQQRAHPRRETPSSPPTRPRARPPAAPIWPSGTCGAPPSTSSTRQKRSVLTQLAPPPESNEKQEIKAEEKEEGPVGILI